MLAAASGTEAGLFGVKEVAKHERHKLVSPSLLGTS